MERADKLTEIQQEARGQGLPEGFRDGVRGMFKQFFSDAENLLDSGLSVKMADGTDGTCALSGWWAGFVRS